MRLRTAMQGNRMMLLLFLVAYGFHAATAGGLAGPDDVDEYVDLWVEAGANDTACVPDQQPGAACANSECPCGTLSAAMQSARRFRNNTVVIHVVGEYDSPATMEVVGQRIILQGEHASFTDSVQLMLFTGELLIRDIHFRGVHSVGATPIISVSSGLLVVDRCNFTDSDAFRMLNVADIGVYVEMLVTSCTFIANVQSAGAVITAAHRTNILGCIFSENYAPDGVVAFSGGVDLLVSDCHMSHNVITNHRSYGAIYASEDPRSGVARSNIVVEGTVFDNNLPGATGSAIALLQAGANVTITGCHFTHVPFKFGDYGNAIYINGPSDADPITVRISMCAFVGVATMMKDGGAIYAYRGADVEISGCYFERVMARKGGAIFGALFTSRTLIVRNCIFNRCVSYRGEGGAIIAAQIVVEDSIFYNCSARHYGGAISAGGVAGTTSVLVRNHFEHCFAILIGGAVSSMSTDLVLTDSTFLNNVANSGGGALFTLRVADLSLERNHFQSNVAAQGQGGALRLHQDSTKDTNVLISDTIFLDNFADGGGGAVHLSRITVDQLKLVAYATFSNCSFVKNRCRQNGGALRTSAHVLFVGCELTQNEARRNGGAWFHEEGRVFIVDTRVSLNEGDSGAGMYLTGKALTVVTNTTFEDNFAFGNGGAVTVERGLGVFSNLCFVDNFARSGAAVATEALAVVLGDMLTLTNNSALEFGGAVLMADFSVLDFRSSTMTHNLAGAGGGAVKTTNEANGYMEGVILSNNVGPTGGAVLVSLESNLTISSSALSENSGNSRGGAMAVTDKATAHLDHVVMLSNIGGKGGSLSAHDSATLSIDAVVVHDSRALWSGGSVYTTERSTLEVSSSTFSGGQVAAGDGGAFALEDRTVAVLSFTSLCNNSAQSGGALQSGSKAYVTVRGSCFTNNTARVDGGAIESAASSVLDVTSCEFSNNSADRSGGTLSIRDNSAVIARNCSIAFGRSGSFGGGVYGSHMGLIEMSNSTIRGCRSRTGGGVHFSDQQRGSFQGVLVDSCSSAAEGGGVHISLCTAVEFSNSRFERCEAVLGGAAFIHYCASDSPSRPKFVNCSFSENLAREGGAVSIESAGIRTMQSRHSGVSAAGNHTVFHDNGTRSFENALFVNNSAQIGGALLYNSEDGELSFIEPRFINNTASKWGGAIYIVDEDLLQKTRMYSGFFGHNVAVFGGSVISTASFPQHGRVRFCDSCSGKYNDAGYESSNGLATAPTTVTLDGCSPTVSLMNTSMYFFVGLEDDFGSPVAGAFLEAHPYRVRLSLSNCGSFTSSGELDANGQIEFSEWSLHGNLGDECVAIVTVEPVMSDGEMSTMDPVICRVALTGCDDGYHIKHDDFDYCVKDTEPLLTVNEIMLIVICLLVAVILLIVGAWGVRKLVAYRRERRMMAINIPDFGGGKPMPSLAEILADPDIPQISYGELELGEQLGHGADGIVYRATWQRRGAIPQAVAVKKIYVADQLSELGPFLTEIKIASALTHPNVMRLIGVSHVGESDLCLVSELAERGSLRHVLKRKKENLPLSMRYHLAVHAAKGLEFLHSRRIIHRDVKPANFLVFRDWTCKIADFGNSTIRPDKTALMTTVGTPAYMAPEVLSRSKYSEKADVFSFGVLLCELYTGREPFAEVGNNIGYIARRIIDGDRPSCEGMSPELQSLIQDCWVPSPKLRPDATEIKTRLRRLQSQEAGESEWRQSDSYATSSDVSAPALLHGGMLSELEEFGSIGRDVVVDAE